MTRQAPSKRPHLAAVPAASHPQVHIDPSYDQREAADAFLRGEPVAEPLRELLDQALATFGELESDYIEEARRQGERSRIWDTTGWIIANSIAREAHQHSGS